MVLFCFLKERVIYLCHLQLCFVSAQSGFAKFNWFIKKRRETGSVTLWQPLKWKVPNPDLFE